MPTEEIRIKLKEGIYEIKEIETKPITLICKSPAFQSKIEYPKRVEIDPQVSVYHGERVKNVHADFPKYWNMVFEQSSKGTEPPCEAEPDEIRQWCDIAGTHLLGLLDLTLKFMDMGTPFVWKYPETYLHPGLQAGLGSVVCELSQKDKDA